MGYRPFSKNPSKQETAIVLTGPRFVFVPAQAKTKTNTEPSRKKPREEQTKMETEQKIRIHQLVEYIKQDPEFPFDTHDELEDILDYYEISRALEPDGKKVLAEELKVIAQAAQTREITSQVLEEIDTNNSK